MKFFIIIIINVFLMESLLIADDYRLEMSGENINKISKLPELQSEYETIYLQSSVSPGDSVFIDLSELMDNGDSILNIYTNSIKNQLRNNSIYYEVGSYKKLNNSFFFIYHQDFAI